MSERPGDDGGLHRGWVADALALWRIGERNVTRPALEPEWRADYEAAVTAALGYLQRFGTMPELVAAYFALDDDGWLDALCRPPSGRILNVGDVEDAAYWRRAQQLIAAAGGSGNRSG